MSRISEATVKTFSIGFDVDKFDETRYAREVAEMFGTEHYEFRLTPDVMELLPRLVWHYGEPFADPSAVPSMYLAEATRRHVKVALNGDGGDESFAGYSRYVAATVASRLAFVPAPVARAVGRVADTVGGSPPRFTIARRARSLADLVAVDFNQRYTDIHAQPYLSEADRAALYTPEFSAGLAPLACRTAPHVIADAMRGSDASTALEQLLDADVNTYLPGDLLVKVDIATMANSLEVRSPLLDHVFMELVAGLPATQKLRRTKTKVALKNALRGWVPQHIIDRPKMGFRVPLAPWFRGKLRQLPADVLLDPRSLGRGILREDRLRRLIDRHLDGSEDNSGKLWSLIQLELWFRTYIDVAPAGPIALGNV
jgi:asparagine synthase (glutamine-hydrolysing)